MSENCYFFVTTNDEGEQVMAAMCVECHDKDHQEQGWFWPGELKGYGPYDILCKFCGKVIHSAPKASPTCEPDPHSKSTEESIT